MPFSTINGSKVPIKVWARTEEVDSQVIKQLKNVAALPWVAHHVAVMADVQLRTAGTHAVPGLAEALQSRGLEERRATVRVGKPISVQSEVFDIGLNAVLVVTIVLSLVGLANLMGPRLLPGVDPVLDEVRERGITDFRVFTDVHPEFITRCLSEIRVLDVNRRTLELFGAGDKAALLRALPDVFRDEMEQHFREQLIDLWEGKLFQLREVVNYALDGTKLNLLLQFSVLPGR